MSRGSSGLADTIEAQFLGGKVTTTGDRRVFLPDELHPVALRLSRVDDCIYSILELSAQWSFEDPIGLEQHQRGELYETLVSRVRPVPPRIWLMFSEGIHHLRAALDNVVWYLAQSDEGLSKRNSWLIEMPVTTDEDRYANWVTKRASRGLSFMSPNNAIGQRIQALQPFKDTQSKIPSRRAALARVMNVNTENAQPLLLLKEYSNADKHRAIRLAASGSTITAMDLPIGSQDLDFKELKPGDVVSRGAVGEVREMEFQSATLLSRPDPYRAMVSPGMELSLLHEFVRDFAIPMLLTGLYLPSAIPSSIELGDSGQDHTERLLQGTAVAAKLRFETRLAEMLGSALQRERMLPAFINHEDGSECQFCFQSVDSANGN